MTMRSLVRVLALSQALSLAALADRNITVDGNNADWAGVTTCYNEIAGDGPQGIDLNRACLENNNSSGNNGYLFALYEATANLPTNADSYFGFYLDVNNDGKITNVDTAWAVLYSAGSATPTALQAVDPTNYSVRQSYSNTNNCGGSGSANGWSATRNGKIVELRVAYGCLGLTTNNDNRLIQIGVYPNFDTTPEAYYDGTAGSLDAAVVPADVSGLVAISGQSQNRLVWTNPSAHEGVLILRASGSAPNTVPVKGVQYDVTATLGNARVVYADSGGSTVSSFTDTGLANGTRYYYRVYNHHQRYTYASGNVPSTSGVFSEPTSRAAGSPLWCYSMGMPSLQMPVTEAGGAVMTSNNLGQVTSNISSTTAAQDGNERWRPVQLAGAVQTRAPLVPLVERTGQYLITGDQTGMTYLINSATGGVVWTGNGGAAIGERIQAQGGAQLFDYADAAFKAANGPPAIAAKRDLIFFATRNNSTTNNRVVALSSRDGSLVWSYQPGNLDIVSGGMLVDYTNNRLFVTARSNGNKQASVRVLNSLTGAQLGALSLGDIDSGIVRDGTQAYVVNNSGTAYGITLSTLTVAWSVNVGVTTTYLWPLGGGFVASVRAGRVVRYNVTANSASQAWSRNISNPAGLRLHNAMQKLFVGSSDGRVYQVSPQTGSIEKTLVVSSGQVGAPHLDETLNRLHVGTLDGRLCSFQLPLP